MRKVEDRIQKLLNIIRNKLRSMLNAKGIHVLATDDLLVLIGNCQNEYRLPVSVIKAIVNFKLQPTEAHAREAFIAYKYLATNY